ncbi:hypothetical protein SAMN05421740_1051 [Parapedobacter koreensis]|uniref:Uncharacterized protein n=1 Tax=Parapedobacter koreensis TaxID=332977 RepID=A0A1H7PTC4_9SPHI|nr:hypothetical protein SAMN05421740_1051 [Parapedobacter koreensis]
MAAIFIERDYNSRFLCKFELFAVYSMTLTKIGDRYSQTLNTVIEELSARNPYHSILVTYAKLLFTFHYNI